MSCFNFQKLHNSLSPADPVFKTLITVLIDQFNATPRLLEVVFVFSCLIFLVHQVALLESWLWCLESKTIDPHNSSTHLIT